MRAIIATLVDGLPRGDQPHTSLVQPLLWRAATRTSVEVVLESEDARMTAALDLICSTARAACRLVHGALPTALGLLLVQAAACSQPHGVATERASETVVPQDKPRVTMTPSMLSLVRPDDLGQPSDKVGKIVIRVSTPDAKYGTPGVSGPTVTLASDPRLEINCDPTATTAPSTGFQGSCTIASWSFSQSGAEYFASQAVWVRITGTSTPSDDSWKVHVSSSEAIVDVSDIVVSASRHDDHAGPHGEADPGEYDGVLTLVSPAPPAGAAPVTIPVTASVDGARRGFLFFDETRQLSPTGRIFMRFNAGEYDYGEKWLTARIGADDPHPDSGSIAAYVDQQVSEHHALKKGIYSGAFRLVVDVTGDVKSWFGVYDAANAFTWHYELHKATSRPPRPACGAGGSCASGVCDELSNLCVPGPLRDPVTINQTSGLIGPPNTLQNGRVAAWREALPKAIGQAVANMPLSRVPNLYNPAPTWSAPTLAGTPLIDRASIPTWAPLSELGYNLCVRDWQTPPGATALVGRAVPANSNASCTAPDHATIPVGAVTPQSFCNDVYNIPQSWWDECIAPTHTDDRDLGSLRLSYAPCVHNAPVPQGASPLAEECQNVYTRGSYSQPGYDGHFFEDYFAHSCIPSRVSYTVVNPTTKVEQEVPIYLCPFATEALGDFGQVDKTRCYDPSQASAGSLLDSWIVTSQTSADVSGAPVCARDKWSTTPIRFPLDVPFFTYRDRQKAAPFAEVSASQMLTQCLADLQREVPTFTTSSVDNVHAFFAPAQCINLGSVVATMGTAQRLWTEDWYGRFGYRRVDDTTIKQWLALHDFIARQGAIQWGSASVLASAANPELDDTTAAAMSNVRQLLDEMERGWDFALDGSMTFALTHEGYDSYAYSPSGADAKLPLSVWLLRTATAHLGLAETLIDRLQMQAYNGCQAGSGATADPAQEVRDRMGIALRYARAAEAIARMRLFPASDPAFAELYSAEARVTKRLVSMGDCTNPLGVSEDDVPLFFGDVTGNVGRFFASSTNLLGLAGDAASTAESALDSARTAWRLAREAAIQDTANAAEFDRRVDELRTQYGKPIVEACGLPTGTVPGDVLTKYGPSSIELAQCYLDDTRKECALINGVLPDDPTCFRGTIGEAALALTAANREADVARQNWSEALTLYSQQVGYCTALLTDIDLKNKVNASYDQELQSLLDVRDDLLHEQARADANLACAGVAVASWGTGCTPAFISGADRDRLVDINRKIEDMQRKHQEFLDAWHDLETTRACLHEADQRQAAIRSAALVYYQRLTDANAAWLRFSNQERELPRLIVEGRAAVAREQGRRLPSVAHPYWYDDAVVTFSREQLRAKRLTFLALKAVEYDFQISLPLRAAIVGAMHPDQLKAVLETLHSYHDTLKIRGKVPTELAFERSAAGDLLRLDYDPNGPVGLQTRGERFRAAVLSPNAAFYDAGGHYIGQAIPFTLSDNNVPDTLQCAERLWAVTANVIGDSLTAESTVKLKLFKRNTAYSKVCGPAGGWQIGRVRPSLDIFGLQPISGNAAAQFTAGTITAWNNLDSQSFSNAGTQGGTTELAGRGVYGDYILLIPFAADPSRREFSVDGLEDIKLRFDYLSTDGVNLARKRTEIDALRN